MITEQPIHIDLTLPQGWNQCTTPQLEMIAATILRHTQRQDRYHPFDWLQVKTELFFLLTETHPLSLPMMKGSGYSASQEDGGDTFFVAFNGRRPWWKKLFAPLHHREGQGVSPFPMTTWQVLSFIEQHLAWIDDPKAAPLLRFPYKERIVTREWHLHRTRWNIPVPCLQRVTHGPTDGLLQDYQWHEYSHLQQLMERYVTLQNRAATTPAGKATVPADSPAGEIRAARNRFLATLFRCTDHPQLVAAITDVEFQVILFWWSGFMHYLMQHYPRCFKQAGGKSAKRNNRKPSNPLDLYANIITTVQKESNGLTEAEVNGQTFYIVLEHLERLAKQNEEMEKISKKH